MTVCLVDPIRSYSRSVCTPDKGSAEDQTALVFCQYQTPPQVSSWSIIGIVFCCRTQMVFVCYFILLYSNALIAFRARAAVYSRPGRTTATDRALQAEKNILFSSVRLIRQNKSCMVFGCCRLRCINQHVLVSAFIYINLLLFNSPRSHLPWNINTFFTESTTFEKTSGLWFPPSRIYTILLVNR